MASNVKIGCEASVATRVDTAIAAGLGNHLPIGDYGGADYRSAVRFPVPAGWANWSAITRATLTFMVSDFQHVGPKNSSIFCSRQNITTPVWSKAAGTQNCESGFSGGNTTQADDLGSTGTDRVTFSSGTTENAVKTIDVTAAMRYYWSNGAGTSKPVFVFDNNGSGQYTELWSDQKTGAENDIFLSIDYETDSPPTAPTLNSPAVNEVVTSQTPTFSWTHHDPQGNPQTDALVEVLDPVGPTHWSWHPPVGSSQSLVAQATLARGITYQWRATTYDASGIGTPAAYQNFTVQALPVVTIPNVRYMAYAGSPLAPRLRVKWTTDQAMAEYQVLGPGGYDSGWVPASGTAGDHTLATQPVVDNVPQAITVNVRAVVGGTLIGTATRSFNPRYGLTVHRRDLVTDPVNWGVPVVSPSVQTDLNAQLIIEYGSDPAANAVPASGWLPTLSAVPKARYVYYRAWFLPSQTASPVLDRIDIPFDRTTAVVDKWSTTRDGTALVAPWNVDTGDYVYGSRSLRADIAGPGASYCYAYKVKVRAGRTYILTGLMKSQGNSGACIQLQDAAGNVLKGGGMLVPLGTDVSTDPLIKTTDWFTADQRDVNRYKTPTYPVPLGADIDIYVVCKVNGVAGSKAWFDAIKLEESSVATPWSPGSVGATIVDAGGVQIDGSKGGIFRYRGIAGGARDVVEGGNNGLKFGGDTELSSPASGVLNVGNVGIVPTGSVIPFAGSAAPTGWLLCQGQSLLRADYPALFTAIGVVFGSVDGTHFTLPDLRQKFPMGVAAAGTGNALGASGGQVDHTHDYTQVVSHDHTTSWTNVLGTGTPQPVNSSAAGGASGRWGAAFQATGTVGGVATGVTAAKNPPFIALNFIIRT